MFLKTIVKNTVCSFLYHSGILHLYITYVFKTKKNFPAVIINYHRFFEDLDNVIDNEPTVAHLVSDFGKELKFLKRYFDVVPLDDVAATLRAGESFVRPTIAITIDDGYRDNFELALSVLKEFDVPVTIFLTAGLIGTKEKIWVDRLAEMIFATNTPFEEKRLTYNKALKRLKDMPLEERDRYLKQMEEGAGPIEHKEAIMLDWQQARDMAQQKVSFGAHTLTHPILTNMPLEDAKREILESKKMIEKETGLKVRHFAYPNGRPKDFNDDLREFCKQIGFESISTCDFGSNKDAADVWALKRVGSYVPISLFAVNLLRSFK
ncbi:MAG: polysaccharide deacetylase family protein [Candidatus Omnitrophica bacterium]|nr:polysaccharide deacetylase family protein [Candidatus Omnitrophota bacterium]